MGLGVSDVQAVDTTGSGRLDLVVTNKLTAQVSILPNLGDGTFGPLEPYRAGTGLSAIDPSGSPEVTSLEATAGVAAGPLMPGGPTGLVTINPGSNTLDVLASLGGGRFANPVTIQTQTRAGRPHGRLHRRWHRRPGRPRTNGVSIYLGNGKGGFQKLATYNAGPESDGLTVADINGDGMLDLLIGNAYGDLLVLQGNGDGTFRPYREANQDVALAVADLTGNGKPDFIYADQSLDRVVVQYGTSQTDCAGRPVHRPARPRRRRAGRPERQRHPRPDRRQQRHQQRADLPRPGQRPVRPGDQRRAWILRRHQPHRDHGRQPQRSARPDRRRQGLERRVDPARPGLGANWTLVPGPRISTDAGPVAVAVGNILGNGTQDLAVANQQANNVQVFTGVGSGFFTQNATTYPVGQAPDGLFLGNFSGSGTQIATLNGGSNTISLINPSTGGVTQTIPTGGVYRVGFRG